MSDRKVILFIACSLDGYIAKKDDDISWLDAVAREGEDYGYNDITNRTDTFIMGRRTYDKVLTMGAKIPADNRQTYIITRTQKPSVDNLHFHGNIGALIAQLKTQPGKDIHLDGGGELVHAVMKLDVIDEYIISIIPVLLGDGIRLFKDGDKPELVIQLLQTKHFDSGLVQLHYKR